MEHHTQKDDVKKLNEFLKAEMSAMQTYGQCIDKSPDISMVQQLSELRQSHAQRVDLLKQRIVELGGDPVDSSGVWGSFAKMVEGGAKAFGEQSMLAALEEGEDRGLEKYQSEIDKLSAETRQFIASKILPAQEQTHAAMSRMTH